jgi:folate-binding protein YgfZ
MPNIAYLPDRAVIRLSGEDRRSFLQGLVTQDLEALNNERAVFAALLTPQGKILFDFYVVAADNAFLIDCNAEAAPALVKRLTLYKLRAKVSMAIDETLRVLASEHEIHDGVAYADPRLAGLGWRAIVGAQESSGAADYHRRRIALGVPEFGKDFASDEMFLTDVNYDALNAVSYKKGCFIGQEVSSRMKRKGEVRRRTLIAEFEGAPPAKGAAVTAGDSTLGEIMSSAGGEALAQIRLDRWEKARAEGTLIECGGRELRLRIPAYLEQR